MYLRTLPGPEKQPYLREFLYDDDIQLQMQVPPPPECSRFHIAQHSYSSIWDLKYTLSDCNNYQVTLDSKVWLLITGTDRYSETSLFLIGFIMNGFYSEKFLFWKVIFLKCKFMDAHYIEQFCP